MSHSPKSTPQAEPGIRYTRDERRAQVAAALPEIVERTRRAFADAGIDHELFYIIPGSGESIISFCSVAESDPTNAEWEIMSDLVCKIVKDRCDIKHVTAREIACAAVRAQP